MPNSIISEGKTTNEAIENGLKTLKVSKNEVDIKILDNEDKRSFFSILAPRVVKVELTVKEKNGNTNSKINENEHIEKKELEPVSKEALEKAELNVKQFIEELEKAINTKIESSIKKDDYGLNIDLKGEGISFLIGYRGETLYAVQNILSAVANKGIKDRVRIILDIEGYKIKREKTLEDLAEKIAKTVVRTGREVPLEPMKAYERKIIHSKLQNSTTVTTRSIGEEPRRRVVISLKK